MDIGKEHYAQFVTFSTAGVLPLDLFQHVWIPHGKGFHLRGIENIILSEKLNIPGEFSPYKFVSKHWWDSKKAVQIVFPKSIPVPSTRGHITVSNAGVFHAVSWSEKIDKHKIIIPKTKNQFKILFMLPTQAKVSEESTIDALKAFISNLTGFDSLCVYKLDDISGDFSNVWLYQWIIEAFFTSDVVDPVDLMEDIRNGEKFSKEWKMLLFKEVLQIKPKEC